MKALLLAHRLGRRLDTADPADLPADMLLDVLSAANAALAKLYALLPERFRKVPYSYTLRAAENVSVTFSAQYSNAVTASTFLDRQIGCTVRLDGQSQDNMVTGTASVLDAVTGTDLVMTGQVFGDAVQVQDVIERITSDVKLYGQTIGRDYEVLFPDESVPGEYMGGGIYSRRQLWRGIVEGPSRPRYYRVEPFGVSNDGDPSWFLRVRPLPDAAYTIRFDALVSARRMVFADFFNPSATVPILDAMADDIFLPLAEAELLDSPYYRDKSAAARSKVEAKAAAAERSARERYTHTLATPRNRIYTPAGF